jgi:ABC-2 type transport system permease protein
MNNLTILWRREIAAYFLSPIAYLTMLSFLVLNAVSFLLMVHWLDGRATDSSVMQSFFNTFFYWVSMLFVVPVITMKLFAEEKRMGTLETLMTAPVSDLAVVLSKFFSAAAFFAVMWMPTLLYAWILNYFARDATPIDWGPVAAAYFGTLLVGCLYISLGLLASSLTHNQIVAAIVGFVVIATMFFLGFLSRIGPSWVQSFFGYLASVEHMSDFARGQVDLRRVLFYISVTAFVLFATQKIVESRKWR